MDGSDGWLVQISSQLLDRLPWNFVLTFMVLRGWTLIIHLRPGGRFSEIKSITVCNKFTWHNFSFLFSLNIGGLHPNLYWSKYLFWCQWLRKQIPDLYVWREKLNSSSFLSLENIFMLKLQFSSLNSSPFICFRKVKANSSSSSCRKHLGFLEFTV